MFKVVIRAAFTTSLMVAGGCGTPAGGSVDGITLSETGRVVPLERERGAALRERAVGLFDQCRSFQAVTGDEPAQDELRQIWTSRERATHAVLQSDGGSDSPFARLRGRHFTLLLGLDPASGIDVVLTDHGGVLTQYIKCPGLEAMSLGCELSRQLPTPGDWPVCDDVERVREQIRGSVE